MAATQSPNYARAIKATKLPPVDAEQVFDDLFKEVCQRHPRHAHGSSKHAPHFSDLFNGSALRDLSQSTPKAQPVSGGPTVGAVSPVLDHVHESHEKPVETHWAREDELLGDGCYESDATTHPAPLLFSQFDILLGLCDATTRLTRTHQILTCVRELSPFVTRCPSQTFVYSPSFFQLHPAPWQLLTINLFDTFLAVGQRVSGARQEVRRCLSDYTHECQRLAKQSSGARFSGPQTNHNNDKNSHLTFTLASSLLGFLEAAGCHASFWSQDEQLEIINTFRDLLTADFLLNVESTMSSIRNCESTQHGLLNLRRFVKLYDRARQPIGALSLKLAFAKLVERCAALVLVPSLSLTQGSTIAALLTSNRPCTSRSLHASLWDALLEIAMQQLADIEEGSDYLQLGFMSQRRHAQDLKASCLVTYLCCVITDSEAADLDTMLSWLEKSIAGPFQDADEPICCTAIQCFARLASESDSVASMLSRTLPQMLIHQSLSDQVGRIAADSLLYVLKLVSSDIVITTIWGLGNSLSTTKSEVGKQNGHAVNGFDGDQRSYVKESTSSSSSVGDGQTSTAHNRDLVINAIVVVAKGLSDTKITALAISMLVQKMGKITPLVDLAIIRGTAELACKNDAAQFKSLLRFYSRLIQEGVSGGRDDLLQPVGEALSIISSSLKPGSSLYQIYVEYLLQTIISKGDVRSTYSEKAESLQAVTAEMAVLLHPLALLVTKTAASDHAQDVNTYPSLQRDAWYNLVLHGFGFRSAIGRRHFNDLKMLARYSEPLVPVDRESRIESPIELNMVLKRGSSNQSTSQHKNELVEALPTCKTEIKDLNHSETIFLKAAHLVEVLRAHSGDATKVPTYFVEPLLQGTNLGKCMRTVAMIAAEHAVRLTLNVDETWMTSWALAEQLSHLLQSCCHRVPKVQEIAYACVDRIMDQAPSTLCQKTSLIALLDLLTMMWSSCLESETHEYEWHSEFHMPSGTSVTLSDDFSFRNYTLRMFHSRSKEWVMRAMNLAPLDVKGLLQTYLSNYTEDEAIGHMSLGRSFALEMGAAIPQTDYRLGAIETNSMAIDTASDFVAQYTSRQEYRFTDPVKLDKLDTQHAIQLHDHLSKVKDTDAASVTSEDAVIDAVRQQSNFNVRRALEGIDRRIQNGEQIDMVSLREALRLAASLLCRLDADEDRSIIRLFVKIPFDVFTKHSIRLGLSLWMGVIKENELLEAPVIVEVILNWEHTITRRKGLFDTNYLKDILPDPFFVRMDYAPSDYNFIRKQQQRVHDRLTPHFLILQFISSHYMAERLNGLFMETQALSMMQGSLDTLVDTVSHPLARELHFSIILFSLKVLRYSGELSPEAQRLFKDKILSAALAWFRNEARWSFGGNRIQIKAETHLLADVSNALHAVRNIGPENTPEAQRRRNRQDLLLHLLENEQTRLVVWLFPLDHQKRHYFASGQNKVGQSQVSLLGLVETAWDEDASLAINLTVRFPSDTMVKAVRRWILKHPEHARHDPRGVRLMLGTSLPNDVGPQLQHLMSWAPVDPISAVTFLLPAYGNHPMIIQYAMTSLQYHDVEDVTFFYVPQIVQSLRYDALGHIEDFIVKTANVSQLFAHQIIWNIKANSYLDEDATEPDPMKPKLDKVLNRLVDSFAGKDREFYEREFDFFNEVTGVSGKLRPFLKASKPEKKQKIEEELRKIKIDPGVYLPSNPDGVVVGIDRSSGKPLQSHAKTPYMATFRIRKERQVDPEEEKTEQQPTTPAAPTQSPVSPMKHAEQLEHQHAKTSSSTTATSKPSNTYEIWQSAIFKVGDDCRQDILALQMISCFRGIFAHVGLPVYVFPYRVTATAPGCGVIDVLPRTISRDMLGREAVNGLYPWFVSRFGSESSPRFQAARAEFVKSLAAYSIISYLMQFKDRHNGNIMFDEDGHILHIDFGFCFDISPGGVRFERAPFKLTKEMLSVMGGSTETQAFRWFEELCVKAFLACRQYVDQLSNVVLCMLDSGLPCFKPVTIRHFRERFVLDKDERQAAEFVRFLVKKSLDNKMTYVYDEFQLLTNGIPF
ncbi:MAG: hypothetical protein Q9162_005348 [Coniocarpon cinnabarinum]